MAGLQRLLKTVLEARIGGEVALDRDLISCLIRHSARLTTRFRVRASGHTACELIRQRRYGGAIVNFGEIVLAGKAEGIDEHTGLDHRGGDSEPCVASRKAAGGDAK